MIYFTADQHFGHGNAIQLLRKATKDNYAQWLNGFVKNGGIITHNYDYNFPEDHFYIAWTDGIEIPLFGSMSISIIVPFSINITKTEEHSHNEIYFMDGFKYKGTVPIYEDINHPNNYINKEK